jgi:hypothetical protein
MVDPPVQPIVYAPVINSFTASLSYIQPCQEVVLSWNVSNADTVILSAGIGTVSNSGSRTLTPGETTTYMLTATNSAGSVSATTTVTVASHISTLYTPISSETAGGDEIASAGGILPFGFGGDDGLNKSWRLYILLIGLLAVAAVVAVILATRKPAPAYAGRRGSTQIGYSSRNTSTITTTEIPKTTPIDAGIAAKLMTADGGHISLLESDGYLGRDDFRDLVIPDKARLISREHLRVNFEKGKYYIEDRYSTNGTKINGSRINDKGRVLLKEGDVIELADAVTLTFRS